MKKINARFGRLIVTILSPCLRQKNTCGIIETMAKQKIIKSLTDLQPDPKNLNRHTQRGASMMRTSIRETGFGDSLTVDREGRVISGNQRLETLADLQMDNPIIVQSDGTRPIVHQRTDLDLKKDPRARKLAMLQNRVGQVDLDWNAVLLKELSADFDLDSFFTDDELTEILTNDIELANVQSQDDWPKYDEKTLHVVTIQYLDSDEKALKIFIGQTNDAPLIPNIAGKKILERIKKIVET